jgi:ribose/xylose/arabinose/galactoside ABC-type transport system permease subunit
MNRAGRFLSRYGIFVAFVVLAGVLAVVSPAFLTRSNIVNVLRQSSINGTIAVGMTFVIVTAGIDLSVGSLLALAAVVAASLAHPGAHAWPVPIVAGLGVGLAGGLLNGLLIAKKRLAPFIVTLGMMTAARGLGLVYTSGRPVIGLSNSYRGIGGADWLGIPCPILIFVGVILLGVFVLHFTRFGRYVFAVGGNELAAKVSGVDTDGVLIAVYGLSGLTAGLAGIVLSSRVMSASPAIGEGYELDAIAAVVIGGTSLSGGIGSIAGSIAGALIIGVMNNGLDMLNVSSYWQQVAKGLIIVAAVLLDRKKKH